MKKKISIIACILVLILGLTGCGSNSSTAEYDKDELTGRADTLIQLLNETSPESLREFEGQSDFIKNQTMSQLGLQSQLGDTFMVNADVDDFCDMIDAWLSAKEDLGDYEGHDDFSFTATKNDVTLTADADYSKRDGKITIQFDKEMYMTSLTIDGNYSTGEVLEKAGLNTLLGMGTVFIVLIFISLIISLFGFIPVIQDKFKKKAVQESTPMKQEPESIQQEQKSIQQEPVVAETSQDEAELVAVIAAAIAEYEGTSTNGFVVRSIKRRKSNKWNS